MDTGRPPRYLALKATKGAIGALGGGSNRSTKTAEASESPPGWVWCQGKRTASQAVLFGPLGLTEEAAEG